MLRDQAADDSIVNEGRMMATVVLHLSYGNDNTEVADANSPKGTSKVMQRKEICSCRAVILSYYTVVWVKGEAREWSCTSRKSTCAV